MPLYMRWGWGGGRGVWLQSPPSAWHTSGHVVRRPLWPRADALYQGALCPWARLLRGTEDLRFKTPPWKRHVGASSQ